MKRILLTIALVAAAGAAGAQTASPSATTAPSAGQMSKTQMNTTTDAQMPSGKGSMDANGSANASMANAPAQRPTGAAATAQKRIEQDGYKNVQNLQKGDDGLWRGIAMRGNAQVQVTVDRAGRVAAQ